MTDRPMTLRETITAARIIEACQRTERVQWINDHGDLLDGRVRCVAREGGGFWPAELDVRDAFVHVSGTFELWLPFAACMALVEAGEMVFGS